MIIIITLCVVLLSCAPMRGDPLEVEPFQEPKTTLMLQILKRLDEIDQRISLVERKIQGNQQIVVSTITRQLGGISDKLESINKTLRQNVGTYYESCVEAPEMMSDVYMIRPPASSVAPFKAFCEQRYQQGGWMLLMRRFDGSLNFTRSWTDYRDGFGDVAAEHWIGLERMHRITTSDYYELLVYLKDFDGVVKTARYSEFEVANEANGYRLNLGTFVEGNAKDSLRASDGSMFSTYDRDNDLHAGSCAAFYASGWWYRNCMNANLNGLYRQHDPNNATMNWFGFHDDLQGLKEATMMIRVVSN
ncbi:microfibril-associated glycoprotein 4-like [Anopheles albimanus]|uniref:Fibrinogen C-terminal domain-containing protein n=1 Tax=Anopheles albimanus TaxID=7167 RepID=A0A182FLJ6_ANOAL|nr:microfibril-associated glycoprotein 4-like [Anopheles albimanus]